MGLLVKQRAKAHYDIGTRILTKPSSQKILQKAIRQLQKATELDPSFAYAFHNLAHAWYKLAEHYYSTFSSNYQFKNMKEYEKYIEDAVEKGNNDKIERARAQYLKEHEKDGLIDVCFLKALVEVDRALEIQYDFPQAHNIRAMILAKQGRLDEAFEATRVALLQAPDYRNASENRDKIKELIQKRAAIPD
jgi:Tfp pilus assembly protein PilF